MLLYSMVLSRLGRRSTYMRRDARGEAGCDFSSKMPRIMSNLPDFPRRPFLYAHLCIYNINFLTHTPSSKRVKLLLVEVDLCTLSVKYLI
jgi:hypothetical protein